ncbi:tRNA (adenosine(37)-N6)-threonylcarbamoyltransferase complex transferase subunit TsaD [Emcibacter sp. SYSU 3D8]|uniref:tRNA (adenosine(37)-N6)-threonylcarbamoyltransferase complex transferase subunit TsaD n=1 Tax=Emcibacter sp. SYSU 3D8 TaxID=3133969 RepID=UPI0031FEF95D
MRVLGIETSCDETAAAVVDSERGILSNVVLSQLDEHRPYGGVVPEIAARAHIDHLDGLIAQAMDEADVSWADLDGVAVTSGPGLIGGVMVGLMTAKAVASAHNLPFVAVNHLEAHGLAVRMTDKVAFPYLLLLVSGGHCQLLIVEGVGKFTRLGTTIDDAVGEAFDKTAKLLGLGYPGGPAVEAAAKTGDPKRFDLPRPLIGRDDCHFSFSGLKSAIRREVEKLGVPTDQDKADLCAGFQAAAADVLIDRSRRAMEIFERRTGGKGAFVISGGVAANKYLRARLTVLCEREGFPMICPPPSLCTDNGAMIAWAGLERLALGLVDTLEAQARARWPLDPDAPAAMGAGVKA